MTHDERRTTDEKQDAFDSSSGIRHSALGFGRLRVVVLGYIVRGPIGGLAWHHLQYVLGLARLGHDVYFVEDSDDYPACYNPERDTINADPTYGLRFAADAFERLGLGERWAYYDAHRARWCGAAAGRILEICASADILLNVSGVNPLRPWLLNVPSRILVDTDPAFTQIRHLTDDAARQLAAQHTGFFSFAENIGRRDCSVPDDGFAWQPTRQPVVLDAWPVTDGRADAKWTTVMQWDSYRAREWGGRRFGMKSESFEAYMELPARAGRIFELAIGSPTAPRARLESHGWTLRDPFRAAPDPWAYQRFIEQSKAEWSVAKAGYVVSRSGWFSERSAAYLTSGRPVVTEETGFSAWLDADAGLLAFDTPDQALAAIEEVNRRYDVHCRAARDVAAEFFDARKVLPHLLERALCVASSPADARNTTEDDATL
ncbi:MAG TPA: hypothetical protein VF666_14560 [Pyrinomonadaceae bacterium]|jgi:hypothetical protein